MGRRETGQLTDRDVLEKLLPLVVGRQIRVIEGRWQQFNPKTELWDWIGIYEAAALLYEWGNDLGDECQLTRAVLGGSQPYALMRLARTIAVRLQAEDDSPVENDDAVF